MPAIVDHEARRAFLARIAADIIATEGLEAATVRGIAAAAGSSTKIVSHYFSDKRALLMATYREATRDSYRLMTETQAHDRPDARAHLLSLLPLTAPMRRNWKVWLAFWAFAISDPEFADEQRRGVLNARVEVEDTLSRDPGFSHLTAERRHDEARRLITLVIGVALQAAFDPAEWTADRQREPILAALAALADVGRTRTPQPIG